MEISESASAGDPAPAVVDVVRRTAPARAAGRVDALYRTVASFVALSMVVILAAVVLVMAGTAWPAIGRLGPGFFTGTIWNSTTDVYGALPFIAGTAITTVLALVIAVSVSLAIAILLTEYAPRPLATTLGVIVDVAAGVPTIVFGAWALLELLPWLSNTVEPAIANVTGWLPPLDPNNSPAGITGYGMFTAGLVLAAMVFPTIVAITRNSFLATPHDMREASLGLGATRWETVTRVVLRQARPGMLGAVVLASGRALGETMAVVYVIGSVPRLPRSLFDEGQTLAGQLFTQVYGGGAIPGTLATAALYELGLVLLALSLLTSLAGRLLTRRLTGTAAIAGGGR